jgi:hypothetical protein
MVSLAQAVLPAPSPLEVAYQGRYGWKLSPSVEQAFQGGKMTIKQLVALGSEAVERA